MTKIEHLKYKKKALLKCIQKRNQRNLFLRISISKAIEISFSLLIISIMCPLFSVFLFSILIGNLDLGDLFNITFVLFLITLLLSAVVLTLSFLTNKKNKKINSLIEKLKRDSSINNENVDYYYEKMKHMSKEELDRVGNPIVERIILLKNEKNRSDNNYLELQKLVAFENINHEGLIINE